MSIQVPVQRSAPEQSAATAAAASAAEPGWGAVLRTVVARVALTMVLTLAVWSVLPMLFGWTPEVILSGSMEPRIHSGDVVVTRTLEPSAVRAGQVITTVDPDHPEKTRTHRVLEVRSDATILTKGDANQAADSSRASTTGELGLGVLSVPYVGRPVYWLTQGSWVPLGATLLFLGWAVANAGRARPRDDEEEQDRNPPGNPPRVRAATRRLARPATSVSRRRRVGATVAAVVALVTVGTPAAHAAFSVRAANPVSMLVAAAAFDFYPEVVLEDSPYLHWRMDETSGTKVNDASGSPSRPGTLFERGNGYTLDQAGMLVGQTPNRSIGFTAGTVTTTSSVSAPGDFSVEAWVRTSSSDQGGILGFVDKKGDKTPGNYDRTLFLTKGIAQFSVGSPSSVLSGDTSISDNRWHHVVGTYRAYGSGKATVREMRLYVDGQLQGTRSATPSTFKGYWRAGGLTTSDYPFSGSLDEVAIYTSALTPERVLAHYEASGR